MSETTRHEKTTGNWWMQEKIFLKTPSGFVLFPCFCSTLTTCRTEAYSLGEINECCDKEELSSVASSQTVSIVHLA